MAADNASQPSPLFWNRFMSSRFEFGPDFLEFSAHPLSVRYPSEVERTFSVLRAPMCEPEERKRFRFALPMLGSPLCGKLAEFDDPRFVRVQFQSELLQSLTEVSAEPFRILPMLESHYEIIRVADDHHFATRLSPPPLVCPLIECIEQIVVR